MVQMHPQSDKIAVKLNTESVTKAAQKQHTLKNPLARSKVTNGARLFLGDASERTQFARRLRDIQALMIIDLSPNAGADGLSEAQLSLIRRASVLQLKLEEMEMHMADGENVSMDVYGRMVGHLRRLYEVLGVRRVCKDITPDLSSILARHANTPAFDADSQADEAPKSKNAEQAPLADGESNCAHGASNVAHARHIPDAAEPSKLAHAPNSPDSNDSERAP